MNNPAGMDTRAVSEAEIDRLADRFFGFDVGSQRAHTKLCDAIKDMRELFARRPAQANPVRESERSEYPSRDEQMAALCRLFTAGYALGHQHTVEGEVADVAYWDRDSYHRETVEELLTDSDYAALASVQEKVSRDELREVAREAVIEWNECRDDGRARHEAIADRIHARINGETK